MPEQIDPAANEDHYRGEDHPTPQQLPTASSTC